MLDMIENLESSAEQRLDEMTKDCPPDYFRCGCGEITSFADAQPSSNNPYCSPMCGNCFTKQHKL